VVLVSTTRNLLNLSSDAGGRTPEPSAPSTGSRWRLRLEGAFLPSTLVRGFAAGLIVALVVQGLLLWSPLRRISDGVLDDLHRLPLGRDREAQVLTVELGRPSDGAVPRLVALFRAAAPRAIVISASEAELQEAVEAPSDPSSIPLVLAVPCVPSEEEPGRFEPAQAPPKDREWTARAVPIPKAGVSREQLRSVETRDGRRATLEGYVERTLAGRAAEGGPYRIDVRGLQGRLPRVEARRLLGGEISASLADGKVVWIARPTGREVTTPIDGARVPVTELEFHAAALDTVLRDSELALPPRLLTFGLLLLAGALSFAGLRNGDLGRAILVTLVAGVAQGLVAWLLLAWPGLLWPAVPLATAQAFGIMLAQLDRSREHRELLRLMVLDSGRHLPLLHEPSQEADFGAYWSFIGSFLDQFLQVGRCVFLLRAGEEPRVSDAWAFRCDLSAIRERRRDFRREPYAQTLRTGGPVHLTDRLLLHPEPGEVQYLVPLIAYGHAEGFWAVGLPEQADYRDAETTLKAFGSQIAELLHARRSLSRTPSRELRKDYFVSLSTWAALRTLQRQTGELDRNYRILDALFATHSTPTLIFDLFGRVSRVNEPMTSLLSRRDIPLAGLALVDFLTTITGSGREEIRAALRTALLRGESQTFRVGGGDRVPCRVLLRPLALETEAEVGPEAIVVRPFGLEGLVVEVHEGPESAAGDVAPAPAHQKPLRGKALLQRLEEWTQELERGLLASPGSSRTGEQADLAEALEIALEVRQEGRAGRELVVASPKDLPQVLASVLRLLGEDAEKDSALAADFGDEDDMRVLTLTNRGVGLPAETFQALLRRDRPLETASLRSLLAAWKLVEAWGGRMEAASEFGQGIRVSSPSGRWMRRSSPRSGSASSSAPF
jgi:hypothetical protein